LNLENAAGSPAYADYGLLFPKFLDLLAAGMTESEIIADYPDLTIEDIRATLAFAADRERRLPGAI
jgi:uncharacterized protein (DUF433 family)